MWTVFHKVLVKGICSNDISNGIAYFYANIKILSSNDYLCYKNTYFPDFTHSAV